MTTRKQERVITETTGSALAEAHGMMLRLVEGLEEGMRRECNQWCFSWPHRDKCIATHRLVDEARAMLDGAPAPPG